MALAFAAPWVLAADAPALVPFSASAPGAALPAPWRILVPPRAQAPEFALVADAGTTVLRVRSQAAAGTAAQSLAVDLGRRPVLAWRWKVDRVVGAADLATKRGDDFAARVYVFFDVPALKLALARLLYGESLPSAAICYVWDNRHARGTSVWSAFTDRVRVVVLESGA